MLSILQTLPWEALPHHLWPQTRGRASKPSPTESLNVRSSITSILRNWCRNGDLSTVDHPFNLSTTDVHSAQGKVNAHKTAGPDSVPHVFLMVMCRTAASGLYWHLRLVTGPGYCTLIIPVRLYYSTLTHLDNTTQLMMPLTDCSSSPRNMSLTVCFNSCTTHCTLPFVHYKHYALHG